jgi:hypothetical protein
MGFSQGYGPADDAESVSTMQAALDLGRACPSRRPSARWPNWWPTGRSATWASRNAAPSSWNGRRRRAGDPRFHGQDLARNLALVEAIRGLAAVLGITAGQLALAWLLAQGPDVVPIPGTRQAARLAQNAAAADVALTPADLERLEAAAPRVAWAGDRQSFAAHGTSRAAGG